ncbi:response regulator [Roseivirga sp.]|uniref:response regulator n=1 Tax=Roseivirga sp. TaxID=1964215 RepID=UPI003B5286E3
MKKLRVLLVEDDAISLKIYSKLLNSWGYEVHYANDGFLALQMMEEKHYDLLLTDNQLPFLSGIELAKRVESTYHNTKVIMVTGDDISQDTANALTVLQKPVMPSYLKHQLELKLDEVQYLKTA